LKFVSGGAGTSYELRKRDTAATGGVTNVDEWRSQAQAAGGRRRGGGALLAACHPHRTHRPHVFVPAVSHSVRLDDGDPAGRPFAVRLEILLWLQPLLTAAFAATVQGAHLCIAPQAGRCCGLPVAA